MIKSVLLSNTEFNILAFKITKMDLAFIAWVVLVAKVARQLLCQPGLGYFHHRSCRLRNFYSLIPEKAE